MDNIEDLLFEIEKEINQGKKSRLSGGRVLITPSSIYELVDRIRNCLPNELREARYIVQNVSKVQAQEAEKAQQIIEKAQTKAENLISENEIVKRAVEDAALIKREAEEFRDKFLNDVWLDVDVMLTRIEKTLEENLQIIEKAKKNNRNRID